MGFVVAEVLKIAEYNAIRAVSALP